MRRKRRGSVAPVPYETLVLPPGALRMSLVNATSDRYCAPRRRKLSVDQEAAVRVALTQGRTLRGVAADFGVSHETVRKVVDAIEHADAAA